MQDPLITLRAILAAGTWAGDLAAMKFTTGWYDEDFTEPQITVTLASEKFDPAELGYATILVTALYFVDVWITVSRATAKGPGKAKLNLWAAREEVLSQLKANVTGMTDINWGILNQQAAQLDEPEAVPPLLRWRLPISVMYYI